MLEGILEGALEATPDGALEATFDGALEGLLEAMLEGLGELAVVLNTGALEATAGAELLAAGIAAVWLIAEGVPSVFGSLALQAPMDAVNPRTTIDAKRMAESLTHLSGPARRE